MDITRRNFLLGIPPAFLFQGFLGNPSPKNHPPETYVLTPHPELLASKFAALVRQMPNMVSGGEKKAFYIPGDSGAQSFTMRFRRPENKISAAVVLEQSPNRSVAIATSGWLPPTLAISGPDGTNLIPRQSAVWQSEYAYELNRRERWLTQGAVIAALGIGILVGILARPILFFLGAVTFTALAAGALIVGPTRTWAIAKELFEGIRKHFGWSKSLAPQSAETQQRASRAITDSFRMALGFVERHKLLHHAA